MGRPWAMAPSARSRASSAGAWTWRSGGRALHEGGAMSGNGEDSATGSAQPRALLFDWDNTLVDNWDIITEAMNAVYDAFGMARWTVAEAKARIRESMR